MRPSFLFLLGGAMFVFACASSATEDVRFESLANQFILKYLDMNPEFATNLGDHQYDHRLNDYSTAGVQVSLEFSKATLHELKEISATKLSAQNNVDYQILRNQLEGSIFRLETLREHEWNPLVYNIGGALYYLIARDFAPLHDRMTNVIARLLQVPEVAALAKANLKNPPRVHVETAIQQNEGTKSLIRDELAKFIEDVPELKVEFGEAQQKALAALDYYGNWLERDLLPESNGDFRLGDDKFRKKLDHVLHSDLTMEEILERAEADLIVTQDAMFETARPLYQSFFATDDVKDIPVDRKIVIKRVLDKLAESHPTNETIVEHANVTLDECTEFSREHELVTVPDEPINLIVMPEFQRGVAVAYCDAPGPLEPEAKTFYAISPTPTDWDEDRVSSFFREYNNYMVHDLTIHEAVPGHYLQLSHANRFKAPTLIRAIFYSGTFVEGWATYAEQLMAEKGYGGGEVKMQQLKMRLRMIINAIIDQKIHTAGMTEKEALDLMTNEGFQEEGEAVGKWRRASLTSTQLSTYYVGNIEINALRSGYEAKHGKATNMKPMHDEILSFGSPPAKFVKQLMGL